MDKETIIELRKKLGYEDDHSEGPDKLRNICYEDYSKIIEVRIDRFGITTKKYPFVGTYGLGNCISIAGLDKKTKTAFMSHNVPIRKLELVNDPLFEELEKRKIKKEDLEFFLVGGNEEYKEHVQKIEEYLQSKIKNPKIVYRDLIEINDLKKLGKSLILDSRNGKIYCHNLINIFGKTIS